MTKDLEIIRSREGKYYVSNNKLKLAEEYTEIDESIVRQCLKRGYKIDCSQYLKFNAAEVSDIIVYYLITAQKKNRIMKATGCTITLNRKNELKMHPIKTRQNMSVKLMSEFLTYIIILNKLGVSRLKYGQIYTNATDIVEMDIKITNENRYITQRKSGYR